MKIEENIGSVISVMMREIGRVGCKRCCCGWSRCAGTQPRSACELSIIFCEFRSFSVFFVQFRIFLKNFVGGAGGRRARSDAPYLAILVYTRLHRLARLCTDLHLLFKKLSEAGRAIKLIQINPL